MVLILELASGGELQMVLDRDEIPEEQQVAKLLRQILDGVAFLHSLNVAHLDIKPQNLVLTGEFPDCDVKLCDFGISRYISHGAEIREILGTPDYIAPEVLNYEPISLATDMWSVGVLLYVLLTGCSPFGGDTKQETFCNISRCKLDFPDDLFEEVSEDAQDLIRRLIVKNPSERLSATDCLQHSWFSKFEELPRTPSFPMATETCSENQNLVESTSSCRPSSFGSVSPSVPEKQEKSVAEAPMVPHQESELEAITLVKLDGSSTTRLDETPNEPDTQEPVVPTTAEHLEKDGNTTSPSPCVFDSAPADHVYTQRSAPRHNFSGLSSERRMNFKRSMDYLARKFSASTDLLEVFSDDILELQTSSSRRTSDASARTSTMSSATSAAMGELFKCTPVFILGEEHQSSDSGSEISTDSSSDRSSIYSDDSLDFILYGKTSQQGRVSFPFSASESHSWKQRNGLLLGTSAATSANSSTNSLRHGPRVWPDECSGIVGKALSRFTTVDQHHYRYAYRNSNSSSRLKMPLASSSTSSSVSLAATSSTTKMSTNRSITGLEALRNQGENLVVIREPVRAGKYMRYSEVQCESVQARIRRFQVHGSS
ncbi:calcium/calmodulin-dependent protein kinase type IV-like isoform X2 [Copidosoma floridanum]|nr:calcium/calmodulin-dependent protein kinase type IV-like isoform X2 [Copidosoma floridanum]